MPNLAYRKIGSPGTRKEADVDSVSSSWHTEAGRLVCRWGEASDMRLPYDPPWIRDASRIASPGAGASPLVLALDFANNLSPLAGRGWFERLLEGLISLHKCPPEDRYRPTPM